MAFVKNKVKLCETSLSDFGLGQIESIPFYRRYSGIEQLFKKLVPSVNFARHFAQPCENSNKKVLEWFYVPGGEAPTRLSDLSDTDPAYTDAIAQRDSVIKAIKKAYNDASENERKFFDAVLFGIDSAESDSTTYVCDGQVLFGVWGMRAKQGRKIEDVIREDVLDHRVFTITYEISGDGGLSLTSVKRKYGHKLTTNDVPVVTPSEGWKFTRWNPDIPQGWMVTEDKTFLAVCEKEDIVLPPPTTGGAEKGDDDDDVIEDVVGGPEVIEEPEPDDVQYHIHFKSEDGGSLSGITDIWKKDGEKVYGSDIPTAIADEGWEFVGWDHQPENYVVHSDDEFIARFRKIETTKRHGWFWGDWWHGRTGCLPALLNWFLLGLGLLLFFLLLWCFVFGKCHFNLCGCDCNSEVVDTVPPAPVQKPCNTEQASGGEEGYMGYFDMGQQSGHFQFEYNTWTQPDRIVIYDGRGTAGKEIFRYEGGTSDYITADVEFNKRIVTVVIEGLAPGTVWEFKIGCPEK